MKKKKRIAYYQIQYRHKDYAIVPDELHSFEVFKTKKQALQWMNDNDYFLADWEIIGYYAGDIEDPSYVDVLMGELRSQQ